MVLEALLLLLHIVPGLQHHVVEVIAILLATSILYLLSVWVAARGRTLPLTPILLAGLAFRLTLFPLPSAFSDDLYRYRWEGALMAAGGNPYLVAPADPAWASIRDETYSKMDGKDFRGVYGPLVMVEEQGVYNLLARWIHDPFRQVFWFKVPAALSDLAACWAIVLLLRARGLSESLVLVYAWCPLVIFEFWGTGHNDSLTVFLLALALACTARGGRSTGYLFLSLAVAAKFWPMVLFPAFTGWRWREVLRAAAFLAATGLAALWRFGLGILNNRDYTSGYLGGWRNNDSLFGFVLQLAGEPYRAKHITYALAAAAILGISFTRWPLERKALATVANLLLLSSNVHPWYLTWMTPMLTVEIVPAILTWLALGPVFYYPVIGWIALRKWEGSTGDRWLVYIPVAVMAVIGLFAPRRGARLGEP